MSAKTQVAQIEKHFRTIGTKERASGEKAYLKSDLDFFGATVPQIRKTARDFKKSNPSLTRVELLALVRALWKTNYHELRSLGIALLELHSELLTPKDIDLIEELIRKSKTWALVDWLACKVSGSLVARLPTLKKRLRRWSKDDDFWIRRSAMLSLLGELRAGRGDFELLARFASEMIEEREFFIRKAIGWVLRDTARKRPELTYDFLDQHIEVVSGLTLREGAKHLPARQRNQLMKRYKNRA